MGRRNVDKKYQYWLNAAMREYRASLKALEGESDYYEAAMVRANIALTYGYKGKFEDEKAGIRSLKRACQEFEATLAEFPSVENELLAARISHYLGNSYGEIGMRSSGCVRIECLERAIKNYERALANSEFSEVNERRANTLNNLANTIIQLCAEETGPFSFDRLNDAKKFCEEALRVRSKDRFPLEFAQTSTILAHIYLLLSRVASEERLAHLRVAQRKCSEAVQLRSPNEVPLDWAETRLLQGEISEEINNIDNSLESDTGVDPPTVYEEVLNIAEDVGVPYYRELARRRLDAVQTS